MCSTVGSPEELCTVKNKPSHTVYHKMYLRKLLCLFQYRKGELFGAQMFTSYKRVSVLFLWTSMNFVIVEEQSCRLLKNVKYLFNRIFLLQLAFVITERKFGYFCYEDCSQG